MDELTERQAEVLRFLRDHIAAQGSAPTRAEIAEHFGLRSANSAEQYLKALAAKGHLEMTGQARGIRLAEQHRPAPRVELLRVPVVGRVAAGLPILAVENLDDWRDIASDLFVPAPDFLLRVKGHSMRDAGIFDGDLLAVKRASNARNGQLVVARVGDEATVKRFQRDGHLVTLLPENRDPAYQPLVIDLREQELVIEGVALGVIGVRR